MGAVTSAPFIPWNASYFTSRILRDEYSLGDLIGEGAFGVVRSCSRHSDGEAHAVKIYKANVDKEEVRREVEMMNWLDHHNVVTSHGLFLDSGSLCAVMDRYLGGDLMDGMHHHQKQRGKISCHSIVHICAQIAAAIQYLHGCSVVHRDIKGDNFLIDRLNITDADCHVALADFGSAVAVEPNERLHEGAGTQQFWSPELFDFDYGLKVDIWAMGVLVFGLLDGRFPFKDELAIRSKGPKWPEGLHPDCADYLKGMFWKREKNRSSANDVMEHRWVSSSAMKGRAPSTPPQSGSEFKQSTNIKAEAAKVPIQLGQAARQISPSTAVVRTYPRLLASSAPVAHIPAGIPIIAKPIETCSMRVRMPVRSVRIPANSAVCAA